MLGFVFYRGASLLDGAPIIGIATLESRNQKTGDVVQTWVLRADVEPHVAVKTGADGAVCGDCPHKGTSCYVIPHHAPLQIFRTWRASGYFPTTLPDKLAGRVLRIGSYGDPTAIPLTAWLPLIEGAAAHIGYTHQWRQERFDEWRQYVMASADSLSQAREAQSRGWRTFRISIDGATAPNEIYCPSDKMACDRCRACHGAGNGSARSVTIKAHGSAPKMAAMVHTIGGLV